MWLHVPPTCAVHAGGCLLLLAAERIRNSFLRGFRVPGILFMCLQAV